MCDAGRVLTGVSALSHVAWCADCMRHDETMASRVGRVPEEKPAQC